MSLGTRLAMLATGAIVLATIVTLSVGFWQTSHLETKARGEVTTLIANDLTHMSQSAANMVKCQDETIRGNVRSNLAVARRVFRDHGGVSFSGQKSWNAVNQFSKASNPIMLPVMSVGGTPLAGNGNPGVSTPVVDEVQKLVGGVATIFQRVNKQGDMLRVATNVIGKTGKRAVGTYIPATNPDGSPNPVVSTLMNGETYNGMAFVVDQWYVTAYEPIRDGGGNVVGALFVGIKQENVASLRKAIEGTTIGKTGYIWVLGGKGDVSGHYIISKDGKRNGEDITDIQDADGKYPIREIVSKGVNLRPGESFVYSYMWKDNKSAEPRKKVAAVTYYEPWDWLIGASCYEDEAMSAAQTIKSSARRMLLILGITGILAALGAGYAFKEMLRKPMSKITLITTVTEALTRGDIGRADELMGSMNDKVA